MAWGISPRTTTVIPLGEYNTDHYLTLLYHAFNNLGWRISYFNRDGIIGYTNISWASYAEEVSIRIINNQAYIKSECVGYQFFFTDYGKNEKNLDLLINGEIAYVEYHLQNDLEQTTQALIDSIPDNQFITLADPPMGAKEKLRKFSSAFNFAKNYQVTPALVLINIVVYIISRVIIVALLVFLSTRYGGHSSIKSMDDLYLLLGFSSRTQVLSGQVWRLITSTFLHFSLLHVAGNMIVLIYIGSLIEGKLGKWNYLLFYLLTGICASITSVVWNDHGVAAGASGAIFGLFGVLLALLSTNFYERNARRALLISTGIFVAYSIIPIGRQIDHAAHFGGVIAGYIFGWIAYLGLKHKKQNITIAGPLAITVIYTGLCIWRAPVYDINEYRHLSQEAREVSSDMGRKFYQSYSLDHEGRLNVFKHDVMRDVTQLDAIAQRIDHLILPKSQRLAATTKSKLIEQECRLYTLLYWEFKDNNPIKYRNEINKVTQKINDLRTEISDGDDD